MEIFIIKVRNFNSDCVEILCGYTKEEEAEKHVQSYKKIYKNDLKAEIWYDSILVKSKFEY
jgi:hypothetical protein